MADSRSTERRRRCLVCKKMFGSSSAANRICKRCKKGQKSVSPYLAEIPLESLPGFAREIALRATERSSEQ